MFLFDTNVISELRRTQRADPRVLAWAAGVSRFETFLSVLNLQELEIGVLRMERRDAVQGAALRDWLDNSIVPRFHGRILDVTDTIALRSAQIQVPDLREYRDALIAATAYVHGLTVVTRNVDDFKDAGVKVINPWEM
jgi:predicted nucleic acid-binding protein